MISRIHEGMAAAIPRRLRGKAGASILAVAMATAGAAVALPGTASAQNCTPVGGTGTSDIGTTCTTTGTATLTTGNLTMEAPSDLAWTAAATGAAQTIYDTSQAATGTGSPVADTAFDVLDLRGLLAGDTGSGWHITAAATTFTGTLRTLDTNTIPDAGNPLALGGGAPNTTGASVPSDRA